MKRYESSRLHLVLLWAICIGVLPTSAQGVPGGYTITELNYGFGMSINSQGEISGITAGSPGRAWIWSSGEATIIPPIGSSTSSEAHINDLGQVAGTYKPYNAHYGAYLWENGVSKDLGIPDGARNVRGMSLNNSGQIVGWGEMLTDNDYAFIWQDGQFTDIGAQSGLMYARACDINDRGQVIGNGRIKERSDTVGFVWENGVMTPLGSLNGSGITVPAAINDLGQVVGWASSGKTAFMWKNGVMTDLGMLPGYSSAYAEGINNLGQAVGRSYPKHGNTGEEHASLFEDGVVYDLNDFLEPDSGWSLLGAYDINDSGQIVGYGRYNGVNYHAFLLTPEPEILSLLMDIRPGSDENPVNSKSNGALPVAIYGSDDIDVTQIDLETLMLEGMSLRERGKSGKLGTFEDINGDSILDLVLHFDLSELDFDASSDEYTLSGMMLDGMALEGSDSIRAVPHGNAFAGPQTLAASWGNEPLAADIPEPATLALLAAGGLAMLRRRSR